MSSADEARPRVSILLPTFNRAHFLEQAFRSILAQTYRNWELIIIDDGSTDKTGQVVRDFWESVGATCQYVKQDNAGAYAARNRAIDLAKGAYLAFFDSDDIWLPHHLENCVLALDANSDLDWVYGACRLVDYGSGRVVTPNNFIVDGLPRPFLRLRTSRRGAVYIFDDERTVECAILRGLYCGLQNSVIRATVFQGQRFHTRDWMLDAEPRRGKESGRRPGELENVAEDQVFVVRALKQGYRLGYLDDIHVQYHIHESNSSASAKSARTVEQQMLTFEPLACGYEQLRRQFEFNRRERRALAQRLGREYFWHIGYTVFWLDGRYSEAMTFFRRGLRYWPWSAQCWKTYLLARLRVAFGLVRS